MSKKSRTEKDVRFEIIDSMFRSGFPSEAIQFGSQLKALKSLPEGHYKHLYANILKKHMEDEKQRLEAIAVASRFSAMQQLWFMKHLNSDDMFALDTWAKGFNHKINVILRYAKDAGLSLEQVKNETEENDDESLQALEIIKTLDKLFESLPPTTEHMKVYRVINNILLSPEQAEYSSGFSSTTLDRDYIDIFSLGSFNYTILTIQIPVGAKILSVSSAKRAEDLRQDLSNVLNSSRYLYEYVYYHPQYEIILNRNSRFKVIQYQKRTEKKLFQGIVKTVNVVYIELELLL